MKRRVLVFCLATGLAAGAPASAHEFIVKPAKMTAAAGESLPVAALSSHVFMTSQELETAADVRLAIVAGGKRDGIAFAANEKTLAFDATAKAPGAAAFYVVGTRLPQVWATTPEGVKPATKKTPGATNAFRMEKFSKALVNAGADDRSFATPLGDVLEIVPVTNPATMKPGDELTVRVLYKGQPLTTVVTATYDGFSTEENTYAYYTEGRPDGTARIKVTHPGVWMARVQHAAVERTDDYDRAVARAVFLFEVK